MKHTITYLIGFLFLSATFSQENAVEQPKDSVLLNLESIYENAANDSIKLKALVDLSQYHVFRNTNKGLLTLKEAEELYTSRANNSDSIYLGEIYRIYGIANRRLGKFEASLASNQKAIDIYSNLKDSLKVAIVTHNLAVLYISTRDFKKTIAYGKKAIKINTRIKNTQGLGFNHNCIGRAFLFLKEQDSAVYYFKESKRYFSAIDFKNGLYRVNSNIARILEAKGELRESLSFYLESMDDRIKINYTQDVIALHLDAARVYIKLKEYSNAEKHMNDALSIAKKEKYIQKIARILKEKATMLTAINRHNEAYKNLVLHHIYKDSLTNIDNVKKIQEIELTYEFRKEKVADSLQLVKEREIAETEIELLEAENKLNQQWLLFGGLGLAAIFSILYLIRSRKFARSKQTLQEQFSHDLIKGQEEERSRLARELHDSVGQKLMLLSKQTKKIENPNMENLASSTLEEVRSISRGLHPSNLERLGLTIAINALVYDINANTDLFFTEEIDDIDNTLSKEAELHLYRIIQESLTNVVKHSEAKAVKMEIQKNESSIDVLVSDNGKGFDFESKLKNLSLGLKTLFERAKILNAVLSLDGKKGEGTVMKLSIPIQN